MFANIVELKPKVDAENFPKLPKLQIPQGPAQPPLTIDVKASVGMLIAPLQWPKAKKGSVDPKTPDEKDDIIDAGDFTFKLEQNPQTADSVRWRTPEVFDSKNSPVRIAQGRDPKNAFGQFQTHYIVLRRRKDKADPGESFEFVPARYYEPSYGLLGADSTGFGRVLDWERAALSKGNRRETGGFFCVVGVRPTPQPGNPNPRYLYLFGAVRDFGGGQVAERVVEEKAE